MEKTQQAEAALDAARDPKHPLHKHLEWDDRKAAESWRDALGILDPMDELARINQELGLYDE